MIFYRLKTLIRRYSTSVPSGKKLAKILSYFEMNHTYETSSALSELRAEIKANALKSPKTVDLSLCSRLKDFSTDNMLCLMNSWASTDVNSLQSSIFYLSFLRLVRKGLWKSSTWNHLVQITHFVGNLNGNDDSKSLMIRLIHSANDSLIMPLSDYKDICIISEAAYRASTAVSSPNIRLKISKIFEDHLLEITRDDVWLVMLIKIKILSNFYDLDLLQATSQRWLTLDCLPSLPFTTICYIMSLYANAGLRDEKLFNSLMDGAEKHLLSKRNSLRVKDVSMLLWSLSTLTIEVEQNFMDGVILPYLAGQLTDRNLNEGLKIMIQCFISVWMLGSLPRTLWDKIITIDALKTLRDKTKNYRDISRFVLMLEILKAETPGTLTAEELKVDKLLSTYKILRRDIEKEQEKRPYLRIACKWLQTAGAEDVSVEYVIPGIYVAGISLRVNDKKLHVDVLDSSTTLSESKIPSGLTKAKIRLLKLKYPSLGHCFIDEDIIKKTPSKETLLNLNSIGNIKGN